MEVTEEMSLVDLLWEGERRRAIGTTGSNRRSSRSHAIWTLYLSYQTGTDFTNLITNQVHLVDLAGSERADWTTSKNLLAEGADINRSLVSLGNVISSLAEKNQYIPYRDSALTWLLKDSLGGNAHTSIIITASPASCCHAQTLNSLRFAQRARLVENQPKVNLTPNLGPSHHHNKTEAAGFGSIFDIRRDIARLASILKVAQGNGGLLKGLTPRTGWNRLINAIENWNHVQEGGPNVDSQKSETTTTSTMTNTSGAAAAKSLSDVMVQQKQDVVNKQADLLPASANLDSIPPSPTPSMDNNSNKMEGAGGRRLSTSSTASNASTSFKCQTWRQSDLAAVPKQESVESVDVSPPDTPNVQRLQYKKIHIPTSNMLDAEARLGEKVYRAYQHHPGKPQTAAFIDDFDGVDHPENIVTRDKIPALVNALKCSELFENDGFSEEGSEAEEETYFSDDQAPQPIAFARGEGDCSGASLGQEMIFGVASNEVREFLSAPDLNSEAAKGKVGLVKARGTGKKRTHRPPGRMKEIAIVKREPGVAMESTDEGEFSDCLEVQLARGKVYKTVDFGIQVRINDLNVPEEKVREADEEDEEEYFSDSKSSGDEEQEPEESRRFLTVKEPPRSRSRGSKSSSSSYESLVIHKPPSHVKVVSNSVFEFPADRFEDFSSPDFAKLEKSVAVASYAKDEVVDPFIEQVDEDEEELEDITDSTNSPSSSSSNSEKAQTKVPIDGTDLTAFRNFHFKEIRQLEQIGKQIQSLQQLSQRYDVLRPYLKKIDELSTMDFSKPDPDIDSAIEHCSGWNVEIEYKKVQAEVVAINRILKSSQNPVKTKLPRHDSSSASHRTSSTSITSDSYSVADLGSRRNSYEASPLDQCLRASFNENPVLSYMTGAFTSEQTKLKNAHHMNHVTPVPQEPPHPLEPYAHILNQPLQLNFDYSSVSRYQSVQSAQSASSYTSIPRSASFGRHGPPAPPPSTYPLSRSMSFGHGIVSASGYNNRPFYGHATPGTSGYLSSGPSSLNGPLYSTYNSPPPPPRPTSLDQPLGPYLSSRLPPPHQQHQMVNSTSSSSYYTERQSQQHQQHSTPWRPSEFSPRSSTFAQQQRRQSKPQTKLVLNLPPRPEPASTSGILPSQSYSSLQDSYSGSSKNNSPEHNVWSPPLFPPPKYVGTPPTKLVTSAGYPNPRSKQKLESRDLFGSRLGGMNYSSESYPSYTDSSLVSPFRSLDGHLTNLSMSSGYCFNCGCESCNCEDSFGSFAEELNVACESPARTSTTPTSSRMYNLYENQLHSNYLYHHQT